MQATRHIGASLTLKLTALVGIFIALPIILYGQFESADLTSRALVSRAIEDRSSLIARALAPVLTREEPLAPALLNLELRKFGGDGTQLKLLRQPAGAPDGQGFLFVASAPPVPTAQVDAEIDELTRRGVLGRVTSACTIDAQTTVRYQIDPATEALASIIPIRDPRGCWVLVTAHTTAEFLNTSVGRRYWETREVRLAAAIYIGGALLAILVAVSIHRSLRRFREAAYEVSQGRSGDDTFTARNSVPELASVAKVLDKLVLDLRRISQQIRQTAEENAHSLKTPLATIRSSLAPVRRAVPADDQRANRALDIIANCIDRLYSHVTAAQRLDNNTADLIAAPRRLVNLTELVGEATLGFRELLADRDIRLIRRLDDGVMVRAGSGMLEVVLQNILDNAIGFSPRGGSIVITLSEGNEAVELVIEDEGRGVDPDKLDRVFDRSFSSRPEEDAEHAGLGLWIARRNVEALGGQITAYNRRGGGLAVAITLPRSRLDH